MQEINPEIFRSYDIRGIYPKDINLEVAKEIGRAFIDLTKAKTVAVGRDMRRGGEEIFEGLAKGLTESGAQVFDIGMISIDAMYFCPPFYKLDAGIMITASHNPKGYNGFKMVRVDEKGDVMIRGTDIKEIIEKGKSVAAEEPGTIEKKNIWQDYLNHIFSFVDVSKIRPLKIVVDAGNGMAGKVVPMLEEKLPIKLVRMNFELDGTFPAHPSNPLEPESHEPLQKRVKEERADVGFIFDGDTDRIFLVDNKGNFLRGDTTLIFLAKYFLDNDIGNVFVYNAICSKAVPEIIEKMGGKALREKVGYVNVSTRMKKEDAVLSGEVSGHYSFAKNYYADSGFITFLMILQVLSEGGKPTSEMVKEFNPYFRGDEINIKVDDIPEKLEIIRQEYRAHKQDELDGVTVDAWEKESWWLNVRPSNTEHLLRITVEARSDDLLKEKQGEVLKVLQG